jgi:hypothetical protein
MRIYAISGAPGAGKSYLARKLVPQPNVWSLGAPLKAIDYDWLARVFKTRPLGMDRIAFDDVSALEQVQALREKFPGEVTHLHVARRVWDQMDENELRLALAADYAVSWEPINAG